MDIKNILIIGTGHAGFQLAAALRLVGFGGEVCLVGDEPGLPYQRPPLSKAYLSSDAAEETILQRPQGFFAENRIELIAGERVVAVDRAGNAVELASKARIGYHHLVLATGARNRQLLVPGAKLAGVVYLRTVEDARLVRSRLDASQKIVVIGAGFIGLEFAAVAAKRGAQVTVIERANRVMARAVSSQTSSCFESLHRGWGTAFLFGAGVVRIVGEDGAASAVETADGQRIPADLVLVGIGVVPNVELAAEADLTVADGILVDASMATGDPCISAIGDCAAYPNPFAGQRLRLESVQNAADQARFLAARLAGARNEPFATVPWFWSDQGPVRLQIAGIPDASDESVVRGDPAAFAFSVFRFRNRRLSAVESVRRPGDHMAARQLLARGLSITPEEASDPAFDLKALLSRSPNSHVHER